MRPIIALALVACVARQPEPQPPRVVCNGSVMPIGYAAYATSTCYQLPADPCWNSAAPECVDEAERRREANERADRNGKIWLAALLTFTAAFVIGLVAAS